jgi:DNA-binding response OmpR family regulator
MNAILIVEDDPVLKNLLGTTFSGKYETLYASDGGQALQYIEEHKPKLILLDLMLPNIGGFEVLQKIRARTDELKDVPVVIVSNLGQNEDKERAMKLGANDYMVKAEVSIEEIEAKVKKFIG